MATHAKLTERAEPAQMRERGSNALQFQDNRPSAAAQRRAQHLADSSPRAAQLRSNQQVVGGEPVAQAMKVRGTDEAAIVSGKTRGKHVKADADQAAAAAANYGSTTFVRSEAALTAAVDADAHNFLELAPVPSARHDFNADVVIDLWDKTNAPPGGLAKNQPVSKTIDNTSTNCEIGVEKGGDDKIKVTHFKKN